MPFDFGEVVLTPFPFTNQTASKRRPAVIISNQTYNDNRPDIVVMAITSQFRSVLSQNDVWVSEWKAAGLLKPSVIKPVFATLEKSLIIRSLGALAIVDQEALRKAIAGMLE